MTSDGKFRLLLGAATLAIVSGTLGTLAFMHQPLAPDGDPVLGVPQLIMFETDWCDWCERFRRKTAREFADTPEAAMAPLRYLSIDDGPPPKKYRLSSFSGKPVLVFFDQYGPNWSALKKRPTFRPSAPWSAATCAASASRRKVKP